MTTRIVDAGEKSYLGDLTLQSIFVDVSGKIGDFAFYGCTGLTTLVLGENVTEIGAYAFYGCVGLTTVTLPSALLLVGEGAFADCTALGAFTLTNGATRLSRRTFGGVRTVHLYFPFDSLRPEGFSDGLIQAELPFARATDTSGTYLLIDWDTKTCLGLNLAGGYPMPRILLIPEGVEAIAPNAFVTGLSSEEVYIPSTVKTVGREAFARCASLKSAELFYDVSLGDMAFIECTNLTIVTMRSGTIGEFAFYGCTSLADAICHDDYGKGISEIGAYAFYGCTALTYFDSTVDTLRVGDCAFANCPALGYVSWYGGDVPFFPEDLIVSRSAYSGTTSQDIQIWPPGSDVGVFYTYDVTEGTFQRCGVVPSSGNFLDVSNGICSGYAPIERGYPRPSVIAIAEGVTSVTASAFAGNSAITGVFIPSTMTNVPADAFADCSGMLYLGLQQGLEEIGARAFRNTGISYVDFWPSVITVGDGAFADCRNLENAYGLQPITFGTDVYINTPFINSLRAGNFTFMTNIDYTNPLWNTLTVFYRWEIDRAVKIEYRLLVNGALQATLLPNSSAPYSFSLPAFGVCTLELQPVFDGSVEAPLAWSSVFDNTGNDVIVEPSWWSGYLANVSRLETVLASRYVPALAERPVEYSFSDGGSISGGLVEYAIEWQNRILRANFQTPLSAITTLLVHIYGRLYRSLDEGESTRGKWGIINILTAVIASNALDSMSLSCAVFGQTVRVTWDGASTYGYVDLVDRFVILKDGVELTTSETAGVYFLRNVVPATYTFQVTRHSLLGQVVEGPSQGVTVLPAPPTVVDVSRPPDRSLDAEGGGALVRLGGAFTLDRTQQIRARARVFGGLGLETLSTTDLGVAATATGDRVLTVTWNAPDTSGGGSPPVNYLLRVTDVTDSGVAPWEIDTGSVARTFDVSGLVALDYYQFSVRPIFGDGPGPWSDPSAPVQALSVPAAPENPTLVIVDVSALTLDWVPPFSAAAAPTLDYTIDLVDVSDSSGGSVFTGVLDRPYSTVVGGGRYKFRVRARNWIGEGEWSVWSELVGPLEPPGAPVLAGEIVPARGQNMVLTWSEPANFGPPITSYVLLAEGGAPYDTGSTERSYTYVDQPYGTTVVFNVQAKNANGVGPVSNTVVLTPQTVPGPPVITEVSLLDLEATVTWDVPEFDGGAAITGYVVYLYNVTEDTSGSYEVTDGRTRVLTGLTDGWSYRVRVAAVNTIGEGEPSEWADFSPVLAKVPTVPLDAAIAGGGLTTWSPPGWDGGAPILDYEVRVYTSGSAISIGYVVAGLEYTATDPDVIAVTIAARNRVGLGPEALAAPGTLLDVSAAPSGDSSIRVFWRALELNGVRGVRGYRVTATFTGRVEEDIVVECSGAEIDVSGLSIRNYYGGRVSDGLPVVDDDVKRNYDYVFRVEALLDPAFYGSERTFVGETNCPPVTAPGSVESLELVEISGGDLRSTWLSPKYPIGDGTFVNDGGAPLVKYLVTITNGGNDTVSTEIAVDPSADPVYTYTPVGTGLYTIDVAAANAYAVGPYRRSAPRPRVTLPDPPTNLQAELQTATLVLASWIPPVNTGGLPVLSYDLEYYVDPDVSGSVVVSTGDNVTAFGFRDWDTTQVYMLRARTVTAAGVSVWTDYVPFEAVFGLQVSLSIAAEETPEGNISVYWSEVPGAAYFLMVNFDGDTVDGEEVYATVTSGYLTAPIFTFPVEDLPLPLGAYKFRVLAVTNTGTSPWAYSNTVTLSATEGAPTGAVCFLADAPVLTPTGYRSIGRIRVGDLVRTADGRDVAVARVLRHRVRAGRATNPYRIVRGQFGARRTLLISPEHRVAVRGRGMVEARLLGLPQEERTGVLEYYNLELPDWERDNMVVAGVEVESLAPFRRVRVTHAEFLALLRESCGGEITPALVEQLRRKCVFYLDGTVEVPVVRPASRR